MSRLPTGQYIYGESPIHLIDARAKLLSFILLIAAVVLASSFAGYAAVFCFTAALLWISRLPLGTALGAIRRLWLFFFVIFLMNAFFFEAENPIFSWWIFRLSYGGIAQGANVVLRVALLMALSSVLTCTTTPMDMTSALQSLMKPLKIIRVPVEDVAMIISVAIQFIPTLLEETDMIKKAQTARGARFESRSLRHKAECVIPLVIPIFISAFRRADELSTAMEARGYRGAKNRTKRKKEPLKARDLAALFISAAICAVQFCFR